MRSPAARCVEIPPLLGGRVEIQDKRRSGSPVRAHPSVVAAVTAGLRRRRQSVLFHPFNLLELACSPMQGTVHRDEARWKGFRPRDGVRAR